MYCIMKTAEEFFNEWDEISEDVFEYKLCMIEFAKMHVEEALKQASEKAELDLISNYKRCEVSEKSIIDSYPLENIK